MLSLRTPIGLGAALSASLAASLLGATSAQAQVINAPSGGFPGGVEGTAVVAQCGNNTVAGSTIFSMTEKFACQIGDKIYSDFFLTNDSNGALSNAAFLFQNVGANHTLAAFGAFLPGTYTFGYTMTVFDALNSGQSLASIRTDALNSAVGDNVPAWTKTLTAITDGPTIDTESSRAGLNQFDNGPVSFPVNDQPVVADFISELFVDDIANNFTPGFSDTVTKKFIDQKVPGPLPILGAAAAFGFSRKLRSRIKQTV
ncbi:hypothetical protein [Cyanobium sp. N5-Cardenillas]|uniref:hypothetical protein n=1 Tax=Cyanobium sp. N5-Cardenillas TaxID=2823720 RepID=UPI0020CBFE53|nr:hypothetical protein [Cyanobium sp. N5-Cardenillas]MCP9785025.1 hypothetical protein [Cyanobium sp. N5-Cardenillas]